MDLTKGIRGLSVYISIGKWQGYHFQSDIAWPIRLTLGFVSFCIATVAINPLLSRLFGLFDALQKTPGVEIMQGPMPKGWTPGDGDPNSWGSFDSYTKNDEEV